MALTQDDIRRHYENTWKQVDQTTARPEDLFYGDPLHDAVVIPAYQRVIADCHIHVNGGRVLDVGTGAGRCVRLFTQHFAPARLLGVDYTAAAVELMARNTPVKPGCQIDFRQADFTAEGLDLGERFDLINIAMVLFHIPEADRFDRALVNLRRHLAPGGRIITTEYLPRTTMRTNWMLVRSRYEFEALCRRAGLRISAIRGYSFFTTDPMGIDGFDDGTRRQFSTVRAQVAALMKANLDDTSRTFFTSLLTEIERATVAWAAERVADIDLPGQKLVVLEGA